MVCPYRKLIPLLVLCAALAFVPALCAQDTENPLVGTWTGQLHYGAESKPMGLRFAVVKNGKLGAYFDLPHMKFHDLGPVPVTLEGENYNAYIFFFRLSPDGKTITGKWSFDGNDLPFEASPGPIPPPLDPNPSAGRVAEPAWTFKTSAAIWSSPAFADNAVYFGNSDGIVYALKAASGKPLWQFKTGAAVFGPPTVDGTFVYVLSDDGFLYKLDRRKGSLVWRFDTHGAVARELPSLKSDGYDFAASAPAIAGSTVFIGSADKRVYAVDAASGRELWHFDTQGVVRSTPAVSNGRVFFGSRDHFVYALDSRAGALAWKHDTLREIVSSPLVDSGTVYVGSRDSNLYAFDASTGEVKWKFFYWSSWVESSARIRGGILYIGSSDSQQLFAIEPSTGKQVWNFNTDGSPWPTPAVTEDRVYIGAVGVPHYFIPHHGGFFAVDRTTGQVAWRFPMPEVPGTDFYGVASSPAVGSGLVFFGGLDGILYAFRQ